MTGNDQKLSFPWCSLDPVDKSPATHCVSGVWPFFTLDSFEFFFLWGSGVAFFFLKFADRFPVLWHWQVVRVSRSQLPMTDPSSPMATSYIQKSPPPVKPYRQCAACRLSDSNLLGINS